MRCYVLDACSLIAYFQGEDGADKVRDLLLQACRGECLVRMNIVNILEIYYGLYRDDGPEIADRVFSDILAFPIEIAMSLDEAIVKTAGRLKAIYRISLADSIALAEAKSCNAMLVTTDHHEFDLLDKEKEAAFFWIR